MKFEIIISKKTGQAVMIAKDGVNLADWVGVPKEALTYKRASHVEIIDRGPYKGQHLVDVSPLGDKTQGVLWPPFVSRDDALAAEHEFVYAFHAGEPVWLRPIFRAFTDMHPAEMDDYRHEKDTPLITG